jgi:signal transduction histidine kinase
MGISNTIGMIYRQSTVPAKNAFLVMADMLYSGSTHRNFGKGFLWSLAITSMHYAGLFALHVPSGYLKFNPWLVILSALISWTVCTMGCILMAEMETNLPQQILFSVVASTGVGAMHITGMFATTFYSKAPPSDIRGYPPALADAVVGIAFATCIAANVLLAHSATVSRNKLAEIVSTRKELWKAIALKETAEAASRARSDFIASASHEIRTPLHHLQGYSDLLAQTELTEEGRSLLTSIQRATKTLSLSK